MEKVIQLIAIEKIPTEYLALTSEGRIFKRLGLMDSPDSQWVLVDLPVMSQKLEPRKHKLG